MVVLKYFCVECVCLSQKKNQQLLLVNMILCMGRFSWNHDCWQRQPSHLVLILSCQYTMWERQLLHQILLILVWVYLSAATAVNNLSHLMPLNSYQTLSSGSRPWYPYSIRFPRIVQCTTCQATYFSQFHPFFSLSYGDIWSTYSAFVADALTWIGPIHLEWRV